MTEQLVWYAAYGSNLDRARFGAYLTGGRPDGAARTYPGARDRRPPRDARPFTMPGRVHFAWESPTWGGGIAFYDPLSDDSAFDGSLSKSSAVPGRALARAYLLTAAQLSDVAAQEMHRVPEVDLDLAGVLPSRPHALGPGRYETLHHVGTIDDRPVLTFTAPAGHGLVPNAPSAAYLAVVGRGLVQTHALSPDDAAAYLLACPGVRPHWSGPAILAVLSATAGSNG